MPGAACSGTLSELVRSIDLMPTLLELTHARTTSRADGVSLAPYLFDKSTTLELDAYNETGIWLTTLPGMAPDHLRYPDLLDLLEVPDKSSGTLAIKAEFSARITVAKDRMLRHGNWKLVYQPLKTGVKLMLFDQVTDPGCKHDLSSAHPELTAALLDRLQQITQGDETISRMDKLPTEKLGHPV